MYANYGENPKQIEIFQKLRDVFSSTPNWRLREVCRANNWNLDSCVDELMHNNRLFLCEDEPTATEQPLPQQGLPENRKQVAKSNFNKDEERIGSLIRKGYRVLILMRGPPGIGKSYLARALVNSFASIENNGYSIGDFICSTDDYFYSSKGVYKYNPTLLSEAHEFNHHRVRNKAQSGFSPIIVDNTNMQLWEMLPYVTIAVQNNYLIEILEPKTAWCNSISSLAQKNKHGIPRKQIQRIMGKYEKGSVTSLTRMLKNTKYSKTLPQMRLLPPYYTAPLNYHLESNANNSEEGKIDSIEKVQTKTWNTIASSEPQEQRIRHQHPTQSTKRDVYRLLEQKTKNAWKPIETESVDFWGLVQQQSQQLPLSQSNDSTKSTGGGVKSLLDLLKEDVDNASYDEKATPSNETNTNNSHRFERHSINCPNENNAFVVLRQIYANKSVSGLWDLFVKCNGDIDWAVDILLKEDVLEKMQDDDDDINQIEDKDLFKCACNKFDTETKQGLRSDNITSKISQHAMPDENFETLLSPTGAKPQRHRSRFSRNNQCADPALLEIKENIENCFVLGDNKYSEHLLKIRNIRSGINVATDSLNAITQNYEDVENYSKNICSGETNVIDSLNAISEQLQKFEVEAENPVTDNDAGNDDDEEEDMESDALSEEMLEISLGEQLIHQLMDTFRSESLLEEQSSSSLPANLKVSMPRSLGKQLYILWVESAYNHMEKERQKLIKEDEDFARLLKNPKYSELKQSPSNVNEILDMEYAWKLYNQSKEEEQQKDINTRKMIEPNDLASLLTQIKLCESFPNIPRETLLDILATNDNDYNATVTILRSTMQLNFASATEEHLIECARQEQDWINQQIKNEMDQRKERVSNNWDDYEDIPSDEAKRLALREFEESRNLAAHHCQLKAECYQKAKETIQNGNNGAAIYYSQIANLHKKKIDMYNHRAANCIMDVHKYTQNNPDLLDLHYLHLLEALGCLDLFLDRHITALRIVSRNYKHVFIITGRGKHSAGGVSTIKNKVKARLKERCLRWSEVNPGLLKVKIFSGSRHSKNI